MLITTKPSAPECEYEQNALPSYDELFQGPSLVASLVDFGLKSPNKEVQKIANDYIKSHQPTYPEKVKFFFTSTWTQIKKCPQTGINKVKKVFTNIYQHPTTPFIGAGLLGVTTGLMIGLSIPTGFMLGVAIKLGSIGLTYGLEAIISATTRAFNWLRGNTSEIKKTLEGSSWKQTVIAIPCGVLSFWFGLNSYNLALAAKIATIAVVVGIGAFALGTAMHA